MKIEKSVKIKAKPKDDPEFHVYIYLSLDNANDLTPKILQLATDSSAKWVGEGTDGKTFDISYSFKSQVKATEFLEKVKQLPVLEVELSMWDNDDYQSVPTLH